MSFNCCSNITLNIRESSSSYLYHYLGVRSSTSSSISFFFWSICLNFSLVSRKNGHDCLTRNTTQDSFVGWYCRIHRLHLCERVKPLPNKCPGYVTRQSDDEAPVIQELWGMWSTPSFPLLPAPLWPRGVSLDRVLSIGQIELFDI